MSGEPPHPAADPSLPLVPILQDGIASQGSRLMFDRSDTDPFDNAPPVGIDRDERTTLLAMAVGSIVLLMVLFLGFRCAIHRIEASVMFLTS